MKQRLIEIIVCIAIFALASSLVVFGRVFQVKKLDSVPFTAQTSDLQLHPPPDAKIGEISGITGKVNKDARGVPDLIVLTATDSAQDSLQLISGESLTTEKESTAIITFPNFGEIAMRSDTSIFLANPMPDSFLIRQPMGNAHYQLINVSKTLSIKSLHVLFTLKSGEAEVAVDAEKQLISISIPAGEGEIGLVDTDNKTKTWKVMAGEKAVIQDKKRLVTVESI